MGKLYTARGEWRGSCVFVDRVGEKGLIFATHHQVEMGGDSVVKFIDKARQWHTREARLLNEYTSHKSDLDFAALEITGNSFTPPLAMHVSAPASGEEVSIIGYGGADGGSRLPVSEKPGRVKQVGEEITLTQAAIGGDSGGAIVCHDRLCGILSASSPTTGSIGPGPRILRDTLAKWRAKVRGSQPPPKPPMPISSIDYSDTPGLIKITPCECDHEKTLAKIGSLQDEIDRLKREAGKRGGKILEIEKQTKETSEEVVSKSWLEEKLTALSERKKEDGTQSGIGSIASKALSITELAAILAGGGGLWAAGAWLVKRRAKRRLKGLRDRRDATGEGDVYTPPQPQQKSDEPAAAAAEVDRTVIVDHPLPKQVIERRSVTVPVEVPSRRLQAIHQGMEEFVRRYPAQREFVESINAFADQYESGLK